MTAILPYLWYPVTLALAIVADAIICLPMIRKTVRDPSSELSTPFLVIGGASLLGAVSAVRFDFPSLAWPVYLAALNFLVGGLALGGQRRSVPIPESR